MDKKREGFLSNLISGAYRAVIGYGFFMILAALLFMAAFSTSFIDGGEKVYYLPDNVFLNLGSFVVALILSILAYRCSKGRSGAFYARLENDARFFKKVKSGVLCAVWIMASILALCTQFVPTGDQITVLDAAYGIAQRDFSAYSPVNYLYDYNHQIGLAMAEFVLNRVLGEYNYVAYQLINAALVALIYKNLSELGGLLGLRRTQQLAVIVLCMLFTPIVLYVPFIYGTLPGLLLALVAIKLEIVYFRGGKWYHGLLCAICVCFAVLFKSNYQIFMIAVLIYALVEIIRTKKAKKLMLILFVAILYLAQAKLPIYVFSQMRGADIPKGVSKWAWVTMGLQEGDNAGWYNGYTLDTLINSDFDTRRQEEWVKADLKERIADFLEDMDYTRDFFVRKTASQWNEPSFQGIQISQHKRAVAGNEWPSALFSKQGNYAMTQYLNHLNFAILAGAMMYLVLCSKSEHYHDSLILAMIIIGGFMFHLVWEAKGQYTLPYFVLLLPYTVMGYSQAAKRIADLTAAVKSGSYTLSLSKKELAVKLALFALALLILWYIFHGTMGSITGDTQAYFNYLA